MNNTFVLTPGLIYHLDKALVRSGWTAEDIHFLCGGGIAERALAQLRTPTEQILRNLKQFGLRDMIVDASVPIIPAKSAACGHGDGKRYGEIRGVSLAALCGNPQEVVAGLINFDEKLSWNILVKVGGKQIGWIDCDHDFHYDEAPDTLTVVGWSVATDIGRKKKVIGFNLKAEVEKLKSLIRKNGIENKTFFDLWMPALKDMLVYDKVCRFSDGYCGVANTFWGVATREITGEKHEGYQYLY